MKNKNYEWIFDVVDQLAFFSEKNELGEIAEILARTQRDISKVKAQPNFTFKPDLH